MKSCILWWSGWGGSAILWIFALSRNPASRETVVVSVDQSKGLPRCAVAGEAAPALLVNKRNSAAESADSAQNARSEAKIPGVAGLSTESDSCIDINYANAAQLTQLPGVGDVLALRIITYRKEQGLFDSTSQLMAVKGIGPARFKKMQKLICF
jgi:competence ComEA-like helix-hairpin-helix protein